MTVWKDIAGYEGLYQVSDEGDVRSLDRYVRGARGMRIAKGRILSPRLTEKGYQIVALCRDGKMSERKVHRLVAQAFVPHCKAHDEVNHKDGDKTNNRAENLEWCSHKENIAHAMENGLRDDYRHARKVIRSDGVVFPSIGNAARETGVNSGDVWRVANGALHHVRGYSFDFVD